MKSERSFQDPLTSDAYSEETSGQIELQLLEFSRICLSMHQNVDRDKLTGKNKPVKI